MLFTLKLFTMKIMRQLVSIAVALFLTFTLAASANAEAVKKVKKSSTTITTVESEGEDDGDTAAPAAPTAEPTEKEITAVFGSKSQSGMAGCKTEDAKKQVVKDLKGDCNAWIKDQKADLKSRYLTSSCEEKCEDCGMSLLRCSVVGTIRYIVK